MATDDEWEEIKKSTTRRLEVDTVDLSSTKCKPDRISENKIMYPSREKSSLAEQFLQFFSRKNSNSQTSKVYRNTGVGAPPISGGKIEGKKRGKI